MKGIMRFLLPTAMTLFGVGAVLAVVGWAMGGQTSMTFDVAGRQVNVGIGGIGGIHSKSDLNHQSNILEENLAAFDTLDIDLGLGDVTVVLSDHYGLDLTWRNADYKLSYTNEGGTLKIRSDSTFKIGVNLGANYDATATVYLPEGVVLKKAMVKTSLGDIDLIGLQADTLIVKADLGAVSVTDVITGSGVMTLSLGDLDLERVTADTLELTLSLGDLNAGNLTTNALTAVNHMGEVNLEGALGGQTDITDNMGDVAVTNSLSDCGYDLKTDMGSVWVNGNKQGERSARNGGTHTITVKNNMGDIDLNVN